MVNFVNYYLEKRIIGMRILSVTLAALLLTSFGGYKVDGQELRDAVRLYDNSMFSRSRTVFDGMSDGDQASDPEGFSVLSQVRSCVPGYQQSMNHFIERNPHSVHVPQILWHHAMNLFDQHDYKAAGDILDQLELKRLRKSQRVDYFLWIIFIII